MDGEEDAESGDLGTDCHIGSISPSDLGNLSQPGHRETRAPELGPLTVRPPAPSLGGSANRNERLLSTRTREERLGPQTELRPHSLLTSFSSSQDDRQGLWGSNGSHAISSPVR